MIEHSEISLPPVLQGQHMLVDMFGVVDTQITDASFFVDLLKEMATHTGLTPLAPVQVECQEDSCHAALLLPDIHITFHAYYTQQYLAVDIYMFGQYEPETLFNIVTRRVSSQMIRKTTITRGLQS